MEVPSNTPIQPAHMRTVIDILTNEPSNLEKLGAAFHDFNKLNSEHWEFVPRYGQETKAEFLKITLSHMRKDSWPDQVQAWALFAMRLCAREAACTEIFAEKENFEMLLSLAKLDSRTVNTSPVEEEALKLIANALMHHKDKVLPIVLEKGGLKDACERIKVLSKESGYMFPLLRLLFCIINGDKERRKEVAAHSVFPVFLDILDYSLHSGWPSQEQVALETLKLLFQFTMHLGPLQGPQTPPSADEVSCFRKYVPLLQDILSLPQDPKWLKIKAVAVNCMINTPFVCTPFYDPERTLPALLYVLIQQLHAPEDQVPEVLTPTLIVLTSIARDIPIARRIIRKALFPVDPKPLAEGEKLNMGVFVRAVLKRFSALSEVENAPGGALIKYMTSPHTGFNYCVNEFLFQLCGEDTDDFIRLTGFGNAAGLLAMRGLFGLSNNVLRAGPFDSKNPQEAAEETKREAAAQQQRLARLEQAILEGRVKIFESVPVPKQKDPQSEKESK